MIETLDKTHYPCRTGTFAISHAATPSNACKIQANALLTDRWILANIGERWWPEQRTFTRLFLGGRLESFYELEAPVGMGPLFRLP